MSMLLLCIVLLCSAAVVWAEDMACFNAAQPLGSQFYYRESVSPSRNPDPNCGVVPKAATAAQRALTAERATWKYLTVAGGLAVEMSQAEKEAVDTALTNAQAIRNQWNTEVRTNDVCANLLLTGVDAYYDAKKTEIDVDVEKNAGDVRGADRKMTNVLMAEIRKLAKYTCGIGKGAR